MQFEIDKKQIDKLMILVDLREYEAYQEEHIENAIWTPIQKIITTPYLVLNKNQKYVLYCDKGMLSKKVCNILRKEGYQVWNLIGGYEKWKEK